MKLFGRVLALLSRLAVALWIAAYLAWTALGAPPLPAEATEAAQPLARILPRPEPPAEEPEPTPEPAPEPAKQEPPPEPEAPKPPARAEAPKPEPEPRALEPSRVAAADLSRGAELLNGGGRFPALTCSYTDFPSFGEYAGAMTALGARFVAVRRREILASVDPLSGAIEEGSPGRAFSPRARDYTGEPGLGDATRAVRARFGDDAVVMMLVPRDVDAGLFGGIARALAARGDRHDRYREIIGRYERAPDGGVRLRVERGLRADGSEVPIGLLFDLTAITRLAGPAGPAPT